MPEFSAHRRSMTVGRVSVRRIGPVRRIVEVLPGDRDGQGYGDMVSDELIQSHFQTHLSHAIHAETGQAAPDAVREASFCQAVLLLRAREATHG